MNGIEGYARVLVLGLATGVVPLIVRLKFMDYGAQFGGFVDCDFFAYWKAMVLIMLGCFGLAVFRKGLGAGRWFIVPAGVYAGGIVLSTLFSNFRPIALFGYPAEYEGGLVLLSYLVLMVVAWQVTERQARMVLGVIFISAAVIGGIGAAQYLGWDLFRTDFGQYLIAGAGPWPIKFQGDNARICYATLFNPNYVGTYAAMMFAVSFGMAIAARGKLKYGLAIFSIFMVFLLLGSGSRTGMAAAVIAAAVVIIIRRRNWLVIMLVGVVVAGMAAGVAPKLRINEGWGARPEIWSKTGPMLKETALIGHGPGTYAFYYQHPAGECISKPHNMYLQIWTGTGGISLLGFLVLTGAYLVKNIRRTDMTGVGIYGGVVAYLIAGLANDSVVSVAPVFWVLFGLGMKSFAPVYLQSKNKLRRSQ